MRSKIILKSHLYFFTTIDHCTYITVNFPLNEKIKILVEIAKSLRNSNTAP